MAALPHARRKRPHEGSAWTNRTSKPRARPRLPSLDLLKGFEAAARQLSFTRAAEELFLTQSALSRQMQTLEEQIGFALFERRHRELRLTDAGQILQATARNVLDELTRRWPRSAASRSLCR
jgi:hypothetical protein